MSERERVTEALNDVHEALPAREVAVSRPVMLPVGRDDELSAAVHEVQNVLTSVTGWLEIARGSSDPAHTAKALDVLSRGLARLSTLVTGLSNPSERFAVRPGAFHVEPLLADVCELLRPRCATSGVSLVYTPGDETVVAYGDADRVTQIVTNLVLNAMDAVQARKHHTQRSVRVYTEVREDEVTLCVQDDGIGMDERTQARVFEPFFTTHPTAKEGRRKGSGLGLAISRSLAEAMEGRLEIESKVNEGTTVRLVLTRRPNKTAPTTHAEEATLPQGIRVLVVDDEPAIRDLLEVALVLRGANVTLASSLAMARHALAHNTFHILLVDDTLGPRESGSAFLQDIAPQFTDTACILMTGATSLDHISDSVKRFLVRKPFALDEVVRAIAHAYNELATSPPR